MGMILDLVLLAILIVSIIFGYKRGLVNVIFSLCAFVLSLIITAVLYNPITNLVINNTELDENIKEIIIDNGIIEDIYNEDSENSANEYIQKYIQDIVIDNTNEAIEETAGLMAEKAVAIIVSIGLFIIVRLILIVLRFVMSGIASLPIIRQFNELGGVAYGMLRGLIIIYVILAILFFIVSMNNNQTILNLIDTSIVSKILYSNNIILNIIF